MDDSISLRFILKKAMNSLRRPYVRKLREMGAHLVIATREDVWDPTKPCNTQMSTTRSFLIISRAHLHNTTSHLAFLISNGKVPLNRLGPDFHWWRTITPVDRQIKKLFPKSKLSFFVASRDLPPTLSEALENSKTNSVKSLGNSTDVFFQSPSR